MASISGDAAHCGGLKRHRKSHAKVKTGCLTCKIRRKKCDETYPACVRCTSTGRKCDGYASRLLSPATSGACHKKRKLTTPTQLPTPPGSDEVDIESLSGWSDDGLQGGATEPVIPTDEGDVDVHAVQFSEVEDWSDLETLTWRGANTKSQSITLGHSIPDYCFRVTTSESLQPTSLRIESPHRRWEAFPLQIYKAPFVKHFNSEREALCFHFFCERTGPEFSGFFDSSFWSGWLLRACTIHPAVQQAMIPLGAVHRRRELGLTQEAFNYCELAIKSYTKAIKGLNQALTAKDAHSLELSVVVSVLFAAFETFQNNYADATKHMVAGLKILFDRKLKRISTTATTSRVIFNSKTLLDLIDRLEMMCDGFFGSLLIIPEISLEDEEPLFPYIPNHFNTLEEARDVLVALVHQVLPFLYHDPRDRATRFRQHQDYVAALFRWSCTYAEYFKQFKSSMSVSNSRAAMLLRVYREAAYLVLLVDKTTSPADALITQAEDPELHCDFSCHTHQERREVIQAHFSKNLFPRRLLTRKAQQQPHWLSAMFVLRRQWDCAASLPGSHEMSQHKSTTPSHITPPAHYSSAGRNGQVGSVQYSRETVSDGRGCAVGVGVSPGADEHHFDGCDGVPGGAPLSPAVLCTQPGGRKSHLDARLGSFLDEASFGFSCSTPSSSSRPNIK